MVREVRVFSPGGYCHRVDLDIWILLQHVEHHISKKLGYMMIRVPPRKLAYLHRLIMKPRNDQIIDHISRDRLDNRRVNLRITNQSINMYNSKKRRDGQNTYRGVHKNTGCGTYSARLGKEYLGSYKTPEEARDRYLEERKKRGLF